MNSRPVVRVIVRSSTLPRRLRSSGFLTLFSLVSAAFSRLLLASLAARETSSCAPTSTAVTLDQLPLQDGFVCQFTCDNCVSSLRISHLQVRQACCACRYRYCKSLHPYKLLDPSMPRLVLWLSEYADPHPVKLWQLRDDNCHHSHEVHNEICQVVVRVMRAEQE